MCIRDRDGVAALFEAYPAKNHAKVWQTLCSHLPSLDQDREHDAAVCAKKSLLVMGPNNEVNLPSDENNDPENGIGVDSDDDDDQSISANAAHWRALEATCARCVGAVAGVRDGGATDRALGALVRAATRANMISVAGAACARAAKAQGLASAAELLHRRLGSVVAEWCGICLLYTSPSPRDATLSRMPSSA